MGLLSLALYKENVKLTLHPEVIHVLSPFLIKQSGFEENQGGDHSGVKELLRKGKSII